MNRRMCSLFVFSVSPFGSKARTFGIDNDKGEMSATFHQEREEADYGLCEGAADNLVLSSKEGKQLEKSESVQRQIAQIDNIKHRTDGGREFDGATGTRRRGLN